MAIHEGTTHPKLGKSGFLSHLCEHRQGCGTGWGLAQSLDLGLPGLGPDSPHDFSLYTVWFPTLDLFHNPGKGESRMPWLLLGNPPPYAPEGLRNSSQPTWVGGWKQRVEAWYMLSKSRIGWTRVRCGLGAFGDGVGNGFILSWPHPFCLSSSSSFSGLRFES